MINLVQSKTEESPRLAAVRRVTKSVTTVVLVLYVVLAAGFLGWVGFLGSEKKKVSSQVEELRASLVRKSEEEVVARKLDERARAVREFLDMRTEVHKHAEILLESGLEPAIWEISSNSGKESVKVAVAEVGDIDEFAKFLSGKFVNVRLDNVTWSKDLGWVGQVSYWGGVKR